MCHKTLCGSGGVKCRFLPIQHFTPQNHTDAIYSYVPTEREQAQNATGTCKTNKVDKPQENAATVAPCDGVQKHKKRDISCGNTSPKTQSNAMSLYAKETHIRLSKAIGFALTLGTSKAWEGLSLILVARLSKAERAALAYSALISLDDETAYRTASVALFGVMNGEALQ